MKINIQNQSALIKIDQKIKKIMIKSAEFILGEEKKTGPARFKIFFKSAAKNMQINLLFIDDKEIQKINKKYLGRKEPTDVIAFSMIEGENPSADNFVLGDAVISVQTAKRNSQEYDNSLIEELLLYVTHALLHLMGYEHRGSSPMRRKEKKYFEYIQENILKKNSNYSGYK